MILHTRNVAAAFLFGFALAAAIVSPSSAQDEEKELEIGRWYHNVETGINLTQSAFSDNYNGGGTSALSWTAFFNMGMQKRFQNQLNWATALRLRFGQTHNKTLRPDGSSGWDKPVKTEDQIDLETLLLYEGGWKVEPYASARWTSLFVDENDPFGRDVFINPNTFRESLGGAKHLIQQSEKEFVLLRVGATARQNFRRFYEDVPPNDAKDNSSAVDGGLELQMDWRLDLFEERLSYRSKLNVYQPFWWSEADVFDQVSADSLVAAGVPSDVTDFTTVVDVAWENSFVSQIASWIAFNFFFQIVYDKYDNSVVPIAENGQLTNAGLVLQAIRKEVQWKQTFGVGLTLNFQS